MEETDRSCDARLSAKLLQSCPTLCDPIDGSPPGSHPWDSPGKNTRVGCHCRLPCMKVKSESAVAQSCRTLSDPTDGSPPGSSAHGIFQARVLEWVAIAFSHKVINLRQSMKCKTRGRGIMRKENSILTGVARKALRKRGPLSQLLMISKNISW